MKTNKILGWTILLVLSLLPAFALFVFGPGGKFATFADTTHTLGQIFGLTGMTMFALTFVLSTRLKFLEDIFGGLDKLYIVHGILGGAALITILFHPILLVLRYIPSNIQTAAFDLLPSVFWSVNFGIIAILGMIFLISITLYSKIKYNTWKFSHEFLGLVFLIAVLHIFMVRGEASRDYIFSGYYVFATIVSVIGLASFFYSLLLKSKLNQAQYKISAIEKNNDVTSIELSPVSHPLNYKAGQFVFLKFYNKNLPKESHPFSIASKSGSVKINVIIKNLGDFTSKLNCLNIGDKVIVEGPYGRFNSSENKDQVWIAGGVGITPFLGMAEDAVSNKNNIALFYSVKKKSEFINESGLNDKSQKFKNFKFFPWITEEKGFLTIDAVEKTIGNLKDKEFFLCGPAPMKESMIKALKNKGINDDDIHEEAFDLK